MTHCLMHCLMHCDVHRADAITSTGALPPGPKRERAAVRGRCGARMRDATAGQSCPVASRDGARPDDPAAEGSTTAGCTAAGRITARRAAASVDHRSRRCRIPQRAPQPTRLHRGRARASTPEGYHSESPRRDAPRPARPQDIAQSCRRTSSGIDGTTAPAFAAPRVRAIHGDAPRLRTVSPRAGARCSRAPRRRTPPRPGPGSDGAAPAPSPALRELGRFAGHLAADGRVARVAAIPTRADIRARSAAAGPALSPRARRAVPAVASSPHGERPQRARHGVEARARAPVPHP